MIVGLVGDGPFFFKTFLQGLTCRLRFTRCKGTSPWRKPSSNQPNGEMRFPWFLVLKGPSTSRIMMVKGGFMAFSWIQRSGGEKGGNLRKHQSWKWSS